MLDYNHKKTTSDILCEHIDNALIKEHALQKPRDYLGSSSLGESCNRKLQYQYLNVLKDKDKGFTGETLRIFERGHLMEDMAAGWLRKAGFDLRTEDSNKKQYGFSLADGKIKGHIDGVILSGPSDFKYPMLWENKAVGYKAWNEIKKKKLSIAKPVYAAQVALYQAYMQLHENPALFTAINADSMEIYAEAVMFDGELAQRVSDKGVNIIKACAAEELLPRMASNPSYYECKWCSWHDRCWEVKGA